MPRKVTRKCLEQTLALLNPEQIEDLSRRNQVCLEENLDILKKVIIAQGVGPYLFHMLQNEKTINPLFAEVLGWLEGLYEMNVHRIQTMHSELESILLQANRIGIPIMPLKGSLLTTCYYTPPGIRPMADIDLLIRHDNFSGLKSILEAAGYQLIKSETTYANHHTFIKPNNAQVVARDTEHPDNPRPIEVHTELRRPILGNSGEIDLTELIWKDSVVIDIFNQKAISPSLDLLFIYLSVHASGHFFTQSGRILHWLDLAFIFNKINHIIPTNFPERVYVPLKLASRAFPSKFTDADFSILEDQVDLRIKRWTTHIPLDDRCGLTINLHGPPKSRLQQKLLRWKPIPWRLSLAYGSKPLPLAYIQYINSFLRQTPRLFK